MISTNQSKNPRGLILVNVLVFAVIAIVITSALVNWGAIILKNSSQLINTQQAFEIAEAGTDYYKWHLNNLPNDYYDGHASTTSPGPYVHSFQDKDGNTIGQFSLMITPPATGTTVVTVKSTGTTSTTPSVSQSIQAQFAIPSFAQYAVVANDNMNFGAGTEVYGPIQSNYGVHFDGVAHNIISSSLSTYVDPDCTGRTSQCTEYAVYTDGDPQPPTIQPADSSVFLAGREFPVPTVDFNGITTNLSDLETIATAEKTGSYTYNYTPSGAQGYYILLHTNGTFDIYKITSLQTLSNYSCYNNVTAQSQSGWGSWSISNKTLVKSAVPFPSSGVIFVQDNVWIDGAINTARLTIAAGVFPANVSTYKSITINNNLTYTNFNGQDVVGLIAQGNVNVGFSSADTLTVDAALVAQNGRVGRYYYSSSCGTGYSRTTINLDGMIATNQRYGFAYSDNTGYQNRNITYDSNLLYGPPPSFPLAASQYSTISWKQVSH
jgi:type II secretory pathway pseudopilin PulG